MSGVLVLLAPGFEEIEAVSIIDVLRRAEIEVIVAGTEPGPIRASRGVRIDPDILLADIEERPWEMVVLPGGMGGTLALKGDERVRAILAEQHAAGRWIGAICAAPMVLADLGLLRERRATCHPATREMVAAGSLSDDRVVVDRRIVTSQGPGTALEFALTLVQILRGPETAEAVNEGLLTPWRPIDLG